jgi:hypothetical protein
MSRRNKNKDKERLVLPGASTIEWKLKNYLHLNEIYKGNNDMQSIIINSFFVQNGGDNEATWKYKLFVVNENFGRFAQYAHTWKQKSELV